MPRETQYLVEQPGKAFHQWAVGGEAHFGEALGDDIIAVPPGHRLGQRVYLLFLQAQRLADVAYGAAPSVADDRGCQCGAVAAVFAIDILNDFLAPLVLEVDVDVGGLVALF